MEGWQDCPLKGTAMGTGVSAQRELLGLVMPGLEWHHAREWGPRCIDGQLSGVADPFVLGRVNHSKSTQ